MCKSVLFSSFGIRATDLCGVVINFDKKLQCWEEAEGWEEVPREFSEKRSRKKMILLLTKGQRCCGDMLMAKRCGSKEMARRDDAASVFHNLCGSCRCVASLMVVASDEAVTEEVTKKE